MSDSKHSAPPSSPAPPPPQVIDLDLLDKMGASKGTEELKEQLKAQEARYVRGGGHHSSVMMVGACKGTKELEELDHTCDARIITHYSNIARRYVKELAVWDRKIAARTDELMALTQVGRSQRTRGKRGCKEEGGRARTDDLMALIQVGRGGGGDTHR